MTIPDVPTLVRGERKPTAPALKRAPDFAHDTIRPAVGVGVIGTLCLAGWNRYELIAPFLLGGALGLALLYAMGWMVRRAFAPNAVLAARRVARRVESSETGAAPRVSGKAGIVLFAAVKYPAVGLLMWWIAGHFSRWQIVAFITGFVLFQTIIGLRGVGAFLTPPKTGA